MALYPSHRLWPSASGLYPSDVLAGTTRLYAPQGLNFAEVRENPNGEVLQLNGSGPFDIANSIEIELAESIPIPVKDGSIHYITTSPQNYLDSVMSLASSLVDYWPLNETNGTSAFSELGLNDGTYTGGYTLGQPGALPGDASVAVLLNGSTGYVSTGFNPFVAGAVRTFEGWAHRRTSTTGDALFGSTFGTVDNVLLRIEAGSNDVRFWPHTNSANATWTAAWPGLNQWVHWALITTPASLQAELYINSVSKGVVTLSSFNWPAGSVTLTLGARVTLTDPFDGYLSNIAIYNRALTAVEILGHYNIGARGYA